MAEQLSLFGPLPVDGPTCRYGEPLWGTHPICTAIVDQDCRAFDAAVVRGEWDADGYTPKERARLAKKERGG